MGSLNSHGSNALPTSSTVAPAGISTEARILSKIEDYRLSGAKVNISAVARSLGITPGLIHNTYPKLAEQIRELSGKGTKAKIDAQAEALKAERVTNSELRAEIRSLNSDVEKLTSLNVKLTEENHLLEGIASGKVFPISK